MNQYKKLNLEFLDLVKAQFVIRDLNWYPDANQQYNWVPEYHFHNHAVIDPRVMYLAQDLVSKYYGEEKIGGILLWDGSREMDWHNDGDGKDFVLDKKVVLFYLDVDELEESDGGKIRIGERQDNGYVKEIESITPHSGLSIVFSTSGNIVHAVSKTVPYKKRVTMLVGIK